MDVPEGALWVRMPRFIGDAIMIAQAVASVRSLGHDLVAWGPAPVVELFEGGAEPFQAVVPDPVAKPQVFSMATLLRQHQAAGVLNLPRSLRATLAGLLAGSSLRVGWASGLTALLPSHGLDYRKLSGHQMDRYRQLLDRAFPPQGEAHPLVFRPRTTSVQAAQDLLASRLEGAPYATISLGAMSWSKRLGDDRVVDVIRHLDQAGLRTVLLGAPGEDQAHAAHVSEQAPGVVDLTGGTPLSVAAGVLLGARVAVGNDSALSHLAAACGVPAVVIFGPTDPALTCPRGPWVRAVRDESLPCLVCQQGACPVEGHPCMKGLDPSLICRAVDEALIAGVPSSAVAGGREQTIERGLQ